MFHVVTVAQTAAFPVETRRHRFIFVPYLEALPFFIYKDIADLFKI